MRIINTKMRTTPSLPRCFQISCVHLPSADNQEEEEAETHTEKNRKSIKLIKCDGDVKIYDRPVRAFELMQEFPKHMVCRSDSFYLGQKTPFLSQNEKLKPGNYYFLLPSNFFQSTLSFATLIRCRTAFAGNKSPFEVVKTPSGSLRIKVCEEMIVNKHRCQDQLSSLEDDYGRHHDQRFIGGRVCNTPQLRKEYEMLVVRRMQWKPKLDTIPENKSYKSHKQHEKIKRSRKKIRL